MMENNSLLPPPTPSLATPQKFGIKSFIPVFSPDFTSPTWLRDIPLSMWDRAVDFLPTDLGFSKFKQ